MMTVREAKNERLRKLLEIPKEQLTPYDLAQIVQLTHYEENERIKDEEFREKFRIYNK